MSLSDNVYSYCFKFPKKHSIVDSNSTNRKSLRIKDLASTSSYPAISVNIKKYVLFTNEKYIESTSKPIAKDRKTGLVRGSFRTRNKFIIARNLLCRLVKHEKALTSTEVSKVVSLIWKEGNKALHDYFEYLSLLETYWYDKLTLSYGISTTSTATINIAIGAVPYENLCASCYSKLRSKNIINHDYSKPAKFRVHKDLKEKKKAILTLKNPNKLRKIHDSFRINQCTVTTNFGIVTEDMFFSTM